MLYSYTTGYDSSVVLNHHYSHLEYKRNTVEVNTDVLGIAGVILTWMPLLSKILSSIIGLLIGRVIDKTKTKQGKARPWILLSGILFTLCGFLLYAVPRAAYSLQIAWVVIR